MNPTTDVGPVSIKRIRRPNPYRLWTPCLSPFRFEEWVFGNSRKDEKEAKEGMAERWRAEKWGG